MRKNTSVPDKLEGYTLQVRHALYELISYEDYVVSVEGYDDVSVETDECIIAEQMKSVLSGNNPVSDRAVVFWKALFNWCYDVKNENFSTKDIILKYVVISQHSIIEGDIPKLFSAARDESEAKIALENARKILFKDGDINDLNISKKCKPYIKFCFDSNNELYILKVIESMTIDIHENSYDDALLEKFSKQPIPPEYKNEIFLSMLGWVYEKVHEFTIQNKAAFISTQEYRDALLREIRGRDSKKIFSAISSQPEKENMDKEIERHDIYIKQLELVNAQEDDIYKAASDYLRTKVEETMLAERGLVTEASIYDYRDRLKREYEAEKFKNDFREFDNDEKKGMFLYVCCSKSVIGKTLQGCNVPSFFGSGILHSMSNEPTDEPEIGWHPRYIELLKEDKVNERKDGGSI